MAQTGSAHAFRRLSEGDPDFWDEEGLGYLSTIQLQSLCELMGIPYSGTRPECIERLLFAWQLRNFLASYPCDESYTPEGQARFRAAAEQLAADHKRDVLLGWARGAKIYLGGNKYGLAIGLLQWRQGCRRRGTAAYNQAKQNVRKAGQPRQTSLDL